MGTIIVVLALAFVAFVLYKIVSKPDVNGDGKFDAKDIVAAAKEAAAEVKAEAVKAEQKVAEKVKKARKPKTPKA